VVDDHTKTTTVRGDARGPGWPFYGEDEIEAVAEVLRSGKVNAWTGTQCRAFEREFADFCRRRYGIALANGTLALELALRAMDVGPGDEVIVSPRSFIASASCVVNVGARPVFVDVDPDSQNITAESIESGITDRTKAVIVVHLAGWPCDMDPIMKLAHHHDLKVVEDCAQAHGALYKGKPVGSFGDVAAFSFCQDKIISTGGEGGMLLCDDEGIWQRAWSYKDHGKDPDTVSGAAGDGTYSWPHAGIGSNFRMTEMQAAIGRIQLRKLSVWLERRRRNAEILRDGLRDVPTCRLPVCPEYISHANYKFYFFVRPEKLRIGWDRNRIVQEIRAGGVACGCGVCPELYRERAFLKVSGPVADSLPVAKSLGGTSLMLEVHPGLGEREMMTISRHVRSVLQAASRANG